MNDKKRFGEYGGAYIPEVLMPAVMELESAFERMKKDEKFLSEFEKMMKEFVGRETPLTFAKNLSKKFGCKIYIKREDLAHTGAHKINNALGQALLAKSMGKKRIIAETGAGQHGVATAAVAAKLGMQCDIYMGTTDIKRQRLNVFRMKLMGAKVIPVSSGSKTLKDAINEAIRDWTTNVKNSHYLLGSALGPYPYPEMVAYFQSVIGREARRQIMQMEGRLPNAVIACVGGGSNAIGIFREFINDKDVELIGVEAGGMGIETGKHAARLSDEEHGRKGVLHGTFTYVLQDRFGQIFNTYSVSAGLDYSAIGPEHCYLRDLKRARYAYATDNEALNGMKEISREEGIIPALESAHAVSFALSYAKKLSENDIIIINLSGRGDKDMEQTAKVLEVD